MCFPNGLSFGVMLMDVTRFGEMRLTGAIWSSKVNRLTIACSCGAIFEHMADRWKVVCSCCCACANLKDLREQYVKGAANA